MFPRRRKISIKPTASNTAYRKALAWLGHSSSDILDLYYHLHDEDSQNAMKELAKSHDEKQLDPNKGNLRATGEYKTSNDTQVPELQKLIDVILANKEKTERVGFDLAFFCKLVKNLYLTLNSSKDKDLTVLCSLLFQHDFLLS